MTLADHNKLMEADPDWVARREAREQELVWAKRASQEEQAPLLEDLRDVGAVFDNVWTLASTAEQYPRAWPILLDHLHRPYADGIRDGIARALGVKGARAIAWKELIDLVRSEPAGRAKDGMMAAISAMASPSDLQALIVLISDKSIGSCRLFLVANLMRSKKPQARQALLNLRDDPDLRLEIATRLKQTTTN